MLKAYSVALVDGICTTRFTRKPTLSDVKSAMDEVSAMGTFQRRLWIFDAGVDLRSDEIERIGQWGKAIWPVPSKVAVVTQDDLSFGLARMHDVFRGQEGVATGAFRTESEALAWLRAGDAS